MNGAAHVSFEMTTHTWLELTNEQQREEGGRFLKGRKLLVRSESDVPVCWCVDGEVQRRRSMLAGLLACLTKTCAVLRWGVFCCF